MTLPLIAIHISAQFWDGPLGGAGRSNLSSAKDGRLSLAHSVLELSPIPLPEHGQWLALWLPIVMAISAFLAVVCDFETNAIRIIKEGCPIIGSVIGVELCFRCFDTG